MAEEWEKIEPVDAEIYDFEDNKELVGVYLGKQEKVGPNESNLYTFQIKSGENVAVWGNTVLDIRFRSLEVGEEVKVEYLGKAKSEKTGREYKNFEVYHRKMKSE